jgi:hypothetical protein
MPWVNGYTKANGTRVAGYWQGRQAAPPRQATQPVQRQAPTQVQKQAQRVVKRAR